MGKMEKNEARFFNLSKIFILKIQDYDTLRANRINGYGIFKNQAFDL